QERYRISAYQEAGTARSFASQIRTQGVGIKIACHSTGPETRRPKCRLPKRIISASEDGSSQVASGNAGQVYSPPHEKGNGPQRPSHVEFGPNESMVGRPRCATWFNIHTAVFAFFG